MDSLCCGTAVAPAPTSTRAAKASVRETERLRGAIAREFRDTSESENYTHAFRKSNSTEQSNIDNSNFSCPIKDLNHRLHFEKHFLRISQCIV